MLSLDVTGSPLPRTCGAAAAASVGKAELFIVAATIWLPFSLFNWFSPLVSLLLFFANVFVAEDGE